MSPVLAQGTESQQNVWHNWAAAVDAIAAIKELGGEVVLDPKSGEAVSVSLSSTQITDAWST